MNAETERVLAVHGSLPGRPAIDNGWRIALPLTGAAILLILAIYWRTAESIVAIWWRSETFAHGFLIVPISLWLIWGKRHDVERIVPAPDFMGLVLLAMAGLVWLVAGAGQVQVVQQYALVAMIPAAVIAVVGRDVARALAFPLAFLLLGVPVGEALIPPLMDWTAAFTVGALQLSGIPVFQEGNFFTIPSGNWSVVEGCSGLRYLIASITVGTLYAYLCYERLPKRLLFIVMSVIVPIIANGMRAYLIVMIGHLSDMKLAHGVDHLIYGWVFFGFVMLLLFWLGSFWRDPVPAPRTDTALPARRVQLSNGSRLRYAAGAIALAAAWPIYAAYLDRAGGDTSPPSIALPQPVSGWSVDAAPLTDWRPHFDPASTDVFQVYRKGDRVVALQLAYYRHQQPGAQLVSTGNIMIVQKHPVWGNVGETIRLEDLGQGPVELRQTKLRSPGQRLLIWDWFRIADHELSNKYRAKIILAWNKLLGRGDAGTSILLVTPYEEPSSTAEATLREFAREMLPSMSSALASVESSSH